MLLVIWWIKVKMVPPPHFPQLFLCFSWEGDFVYLWIRLFITIYNMKRKKNQNQRAIIETKTNIIQSRLYKCKGRIYQKKKITFEHRPKLHLQIFWRSFSLPWMLSILSKATNEGKESFHARENIDHICSNRERKFCFFLVRK